MRYLCGGLLAVTAATVRTLAATTTPILDVVLVVALLYELLVSVVTPRQRSDIAVCHGSEIRTILVEQDDDAKHRAGF